MSKSSGDLIGSHGAEKEESISISLRLLLTTLHNNESSMEARRIELR